MEKAGAIELQYPYSYLVPNAGGFLQNAERPLI